MKNVLIIIPAYNEEENILDTVNKIMGLKKDKLYVIDYIVINDGSTDNTEKILNDNKIKHICLINNLGIGGAVQTGYMYAYYNNYDIAIQFDGDGQHDANYIRDLIKEIDHGADMVVGSRFVSNLSQFVSTSTRRFGIKILSKIIRMCTGFKIYDPTSGFRAVNRKVIEKFAFHYPLEYPEPETVANLAKNNYEIKEIPVKMLARKHGKSSINLKKSIYYMFSVSLSIIVTCLSKEGN